MDFTFGSKKQSLYIFWKESSRFYIFLLGYLLFLLLFNLEGLKQMFKDLVKPQLEL